MKYNLFVLSLFLNEAQSKTKRAVTTDLKDYQDESDFICDGDGVQNVVNDMSVMEYMDDQDDASDEPKAPKKTTGKAKKKEKTASNSTIIDSNKTNTTTNTTNLVQQKNATIVKLNKVDMSDKKTLATKPAEDKKPEAKKVE